MLVLEDGTTLRGTAFGAEGETFGEMVFNTGMTGYQETLTDPSYCRQIVAMTAPHIGNTGVNTEDPESRRVWVSGYVVREPARIVSSWRARGDLDAYLRAGGVPGIAVRGTRVLTRRVRERGAMRAAISTTETDPARLLDRVLASPQMTGADLARVVSTPEPYTVRPSGQVRYRVVAVDLGIKASTPRHLAARGCEVLVVPATSSAEQILAVSPDGVFFSNGPGDPAAATYAVDAMRGVLDAGLPVFGICLGSQILALALGLRTYKLRYGHRGVNQPVMDLATGRVYITSHNHGFAAAQPGVPGPAGAGSRDAAGSMTAGTPERCDSVPVITGSMPHRSGLAAAGTSAGTAIWSHVSPEARQPFETPYGPAEVSHVNLNDGVVEGLLLRDRPVFSVQYHPEAAPGPHDAADHFDRFCSLLERARG
ncbi:MAG TPA: glutamine-hydrolyzing carbamoyl-phosphate synthase small subunit [Streptosporangiaceae bacterium]|nr:glutamine-hydrolyzing carbamoyl-phosphate synthase small subunit [Streptosporangiaceae bacterium]